MASLDPYKQIADEIDAGTLDKALWVKAWAEGQGERDKATAIYIKLRVDGIAVARKLEQAELRARNQRYADDLARQQRVQNPGPEIGPWIIGTILFGIFLGIVLLIFFHISN